MNASSITTQQRYTGAHPCPVCNGWDSTRRGKGRRCYGFLSHDGLYAHCTREEYAGALPLNPRTETYAHRLGASCKCGAAHLAPSWAPAPLAPIGARSSSARLERSNARPDRAPRSSGDELASRRQELADASSADASSAGEAHETIVARAPSAVYQYRDASGALVHEVLRFPVIDTVTGEHVGKTFKQRRPIGRGKWAYNLDGVHRVLYRLPELLGAPLDAPVFVCEGEKCADALARQELVSTCNVGGAGKWADEYTDALRGRPVVILPDNDPYVPGKPHTSYTGQKHAQALAEAVYGHAASVRVLMLPELAPKGDVYDWLEAGHTRDELLALVDACPAWTPDAPSIVPTVPALPVLPGEGDELAPDRASRETSSPRSGARSSRRSGTDTGDTDGAAPQGIPGAIVLCTLRYETLVYTDASECPGVYVVPSGRGNIACLLGCHVAVSRVDASEAPGRRSELLVTFTAAALPDAPVRVSINRDTAMNGEAYEALLGLPGVALPGSKKDYEHAWKALQALASLAGANDPGRRVRRVDALGWHAGAWVRVNGYIDASGVYPNGRIVAAVDETWPQRLPDRPDELPSRLDVSRVRRLLDFWPEDVTRFPLAFLGACAYVMRPEHDGTPRWEIELFGNSDWQKTTFINWALRLFYGAGYRYDTPTTLTEKKAGAPGDTALGRAGTRAALPYHAYLDYDFNQKPGSPNYERQQQERLDSLSATGDNATSGNKSTRDGRTVSRARARGLLVRAGEPDPYDYSTRHEGESADARGATFYLDGSSAPGRQERLALSRELAAHAQELDTLSVLYVRWLAQGYAQGDALATWERLHVHAARLVAAEDLRGEYPRRHSRCIEQTEDIVSGVLSYAAFLRAHDAHAGAGVLIEGAALADELERRLPAFIRERLAASDALARRYEGARGGTTGADALSTALCAFLRAGLWHGDYYTEAQQGGTPRETPVALEHRGYEPFAGEYRRRMRATLLGRETDDGRYLAIDKGTLETIARDAARADKRITYTTLDKLLSDLLKAGAVEGSGGDHPYVRRVRTGPNPKDRASLVCFLKTRIWPELLTGAQEDGDTDGEDETSSPQELATPAPDRGARIERQELADTYEGDELADAASSEDARAEDERVRRVI